MFLLESWRISITLHGVTLRNKLNTSDTLTGSTVHPYLLNVELDKPQNWFECLGEEKPFMLVPGMEPLLLRCPANSPVTLPNAPLRHQFKKFPYEIL